MTAPGAPRLAMRPGYVPSHSTLTKWRSGTTYETALGALLRGVEYGPGECWRWKGSRNHHGYGVVRHWQFEGALAHRFAWWIFNGPVPAGLELDHLCRVRHCVNPAHLEPVTPKTNSERSPHFHKTHCSRGHEYTSDNTIVRRNSRACRECYRTVYDVRRGRRAA